MKIISTSIFINFFVFLQILGNEAYGQSQNQNFILSRTYKTAKTSVSGNIQEATQQVQYTDGLGRPIQNISVHASPTMGNTSPNDIINQTQYDALGRVISTSLPYPAASNGAFQDNALQSAINFYNTPSFDNYNARGFVQTTYEPSGLNRPIKQFKAGSSVALNLNYKVNGANEVKLYTVTLGNTDNDPPVLGQNNFYPANELSYVETIDENGNTVREYTDKGGKTILKRVYETSNNPLDTYYVFNELGQLSFILQPKFVNLTDVNKLAFRYTYNSKGLLTKKLIPGGGEIIITYNDQDLISTSTDARGRKTYYLYDSLNRPTETGEVVNNTQVALTRTKYDGYPTSSTLENYSKPDFPQNESGYPNASDVSSNIRGLVTVTATRIMKGDVLPSSNDKWYFTTNYYNDRQQLIQTIRDLYDFLGNAKEYHVRQLRFDGRIEKERILQSVNSGEHSIEKIYSYDHADRLLATQYVVKKGTTIKKNIVLAASRYDAVGQLKQKFLHSISNNQFTEQLEYRYTPRSFLSKILGKTSASDNFGLDIRYDQPINASAQLNGNISQLFWQQGTSKWTGFNFSYDGANRLTKAEGIPSNLGTNFVSFPYKENITEYDRNGNIIKLTRYGNDTQWDDLTYDYDGNQLTRVKDATGNSAGFNNGTSGENLDYAYDASGNLIQDANRSIAQNGIKYNLLNLIARIPGDSLTYDYDASGTKVRITRSNLYHTRYAGVFEYNESENLTRIDTEEGQIKITNGGNTYSLEYYLKDHLGNVRVVLDEQGNKIQETEYFAFGLSIPKTGSGTNKYLFNGKELQPKTGFLDFKWRQYDPTVARFFSVDGLAEKFPDLTTYQFASNDPVSRLEIDGLEGIRFNEAKPQGVEFYRSSDNPNARTSPRPAFANTPAPQTFVGPMGPRHVFNEEMKVTSDAYLRHKDWPIIGDVFAAKDKVHLDNLKDGPDLMRDLGTAVGPAIETALLFQTFGGGASMELGIAKLAKGAFTKSNHSVAFQMELAANLYPGKAAGAHFKAANQALADAMASDATFANSMQQLGIKVPIGKMGNATKGKIPGWVWHHDRDKGIMQLVPEYQHKTGSNFWSILHPDNGRGGMSLWGGGYR